jgi:hypothetical protein
MNRTRWLTILALLICWSIPLVFILAHPNPVDGHPTPRPTSSSIGTNVVLLPLVLKESGNVLDNPSFGGAEGDSCLWWVWDGRGWNGPNEGCFQEQRPAVGWTAYWFDRGPDQCPPYTTGRPEVLVLRKEIDARRILDGEAFTFWRCHHIGLLQQVDVPPGTYRLTAHAHGWYSDCSSRPYDGPYDSDCETPIHWAKMELRVGIDPAGGVDPRGSSVVWSEPAECYGQYCELTVDVSLNGRATVFLDSRTTAPLKHEDVYWDAISLARQ